MIGARWLGRDRRRGSWTGDRGRRARADRGRASWTGARRDEPDRGAEAPRRAARSPKIRIRLRFLVAVAALAALLAGGWLWVRDSPLVAVKRVTVTGVSGPDASQIGGALTSAARNMTTLDVRVGQLRSVVAQYSVVKSVSVSTEFPHGMRIHVVERLPVAAIRLDGRTVAVAADGTLLQDVAAGALPVIAIGAPPGGLRLTDAAALAALRALAAAPYQMLARVGTLTTVAGHGLVAQVRGGPSVYLGDTTQMAAKWIATAAVLADAGSAGASYIDVTDPARPAAGSPQAATGSGPSAQTSGG